MSLSIIFTTLFSGKDILEEKGGRKTVDTISKASISPCRMKLKIVHSVDSCYKSAN
jgi:hypothetical protein